MSEQEPTAPEQIALDPPAIDAPKRFSVDNYAYKLAPRLGVRGWLRWGWRQVTSMRLALVLLLLLGLAAIPGSLLPQRPTTPPPGSPTAVAPAMSLRVTTVRTSAPGG